MSTLKGMIFMEKIEKNVSTTLRVSQDVIAAIAKRAALEVEGVCCIVSRKNDIKKIFVKSENDCSGIDIKLGIDVAEITVSIGIVNGVRSVTAAEQVQAAVKSQVQDLTGVVVSKVNVIVADVCFDNKD